MTLNMAFLPRNNGALDTNPPVGVDEALSVHGSDWLWAVTALYIVSFLVLTGICFVVPPPKRVFHILLAMALLAGATTYYAQASDLGWSAVQQADHLGSGAVREVFFARYINWAVSFPSVALSLGLLSGMSWTTVLSNLFLAWFWVVAYLAGAYTTTAYKWGFFAFGTFAWLILALSTLNESREEAALRGVGRDYVVVSVLANVAWVLYPVAWALTDGGNVLGVNSAAVFFGVLDLVSLPLFTVVFLVLARGWSYESLSLNFSEYRGFRPGTTLETNKPTAVENH